MRYLVLLVLANIIFGIVNYFSVKLVGPSWGIKEFVSFTLITSLVTIPAMGLLFYVFGHGTKEFQFGTIYLVSVFLGIFISILTQVLFLKNSLSLEQGVGLVICTLGILVMNFSYIRSIFS